MKKLMVLLVLIFSGCDRNGPTVGAVLDLPSPQVEKLENGIELVWFEDDRYPLFDVLITVKSGFRDDPVGKSGVAQLLSASLSRGAKGLSAHEYALAIEKLAASRYFSVDENSYSMGIHGLSADYDRLVGLLLDVVLQPNLEAAEITREQARITDEWKHIGDHAQTLVNLAFHRLVASGTSYGRGALFSLSEFKSLTPQDVRDFYKAHFVPSNTLIMLVGKFDRAAARKQILERTEGWKGQPPAPMEKSFSDPRFGVRTPEQVLLVNRPNLTQAQIRIGLQGPLIDDPKHFELAVGNALFGEYFQSRLNRTLRDRLGMTYGASSGFEYSLGHGVFSIRTYTSNAKAGEAAKWAIELFSNWSKGPLEYDEVNKAKEYLEGGFPLAVSTLQAIASRWLGGYLFGLGDEYLKLYPKRISQVDPESVARSLRETFGGKIPYVVIAGDASRVKPVLLEAGFPAVKQIEVSDLVR